MAKALVPTHPVLGQGRLLTQQLVAAGEAVLDVRTKVAARVRLMAVGNTSKNDPNDARSVAVAALRSPVRRPAATGPGAGTCSRFI